MLCGLVFLSGAILLIANDSQTKSRALDDVHSKYGERDTDLERTLRDREEELEISKSAMDQALMELHELRTVSLVHV